jgi:hypothetical protein
MTTSSGDSAARPGPAGHRGGVHEPSCAWLGQHSFDFRWHYYDEGDSPFAPDPPAGGDLDVTANARFIAVVVPEVAALGIATTTFDAAAFFDERWSG